MTPERFRELRETLRLTERDCARLSGYSAGAVRHWVLGEAQVWPPFAAWLERQAARWLADPPPRREAPEPEVEAPPRAVSRPKLPRVAFLRMSGKGGRLWHAVEKPRFGPPDRWTLAVCGVRPVGAFGWEVEAPGEDATCLRCIPKLRQQMRQQAKEAA